jgi:hypothetical protein
MEKLYITKKLKIFVLFLKEKKMSYSDDDYFYACDDMKYVFDMAERNLIAAEHAQDYWDMLVARCYTKQMEIEKFLEEEQKLRLAAENAVKQTYSNVRGKKNQQLVFKWVKRTLLRADKLKESTQRALYSLNSDLSQRDEAEREYYELEAESNQSTRLAGYSPQDCIGR